MEFNALLTACLTNGIGGACAAAVLWFAWYRETKSIPGMLQTFAEVQDKLLNSFTMLTREERQVYQVWHNENRVRLDRLQVDLQEQRHLLRNLAHVLGIKLAVAAERDRQESTVQDSGDGNNPVSP